MYEIWLGLNILYGLMWDYMPFVVSTVVLFAVLLTYAIQHHANWRGGFKGGVLGVVLITFVTFLFFPYLTKSSLSELGYWIDYVFLLQIAGGYGLVFGLGFIWPLSALVARKTQTAHR
jgi:hypothetical protein